MVLSGWLMMILPSNTQEFKSVNTKTNANFIQRNSLTKLLATTLCKLLLLAKAFKPSPFHKRARDATQRPPLSSTAPAESSCLRMLAINQNGFMVSLVTKKETHMLSVESLRKEHISFLFRWIGINSRLQTQIHNSQLSTAMELLQLNLALTRLQGLQMTSSGPRPKS